MQTGIDKPRDAMKTLLSKSTRTVTPWSFPKQTDRLAQPLVVDNNNNKHPQSTAWEATQSLLPHTCSTYSNFPAPKSPPTALLRPSTARNFLCSLLFSASSTAARRSFSRAR